MEKLAIQGGSPVRVKPFQNWPVWDEREEQALINVLHSGIWGLSAEEGLIDCFEREYALVHQAKYGRCVFNGTAALEVSKRAINI